MGILSYLDLIDLVESGVIDAPVEAVRGASIDVSLGDTIMLENSVPAYDSVVDPRKPDHSMIQRTMLPSGYIMAPREFVLGSIVERLNMPDDLVAFFVLRSSIGRIGISHCLATFADPGFCGRITLELHSVRAKKSVLLLPGMSIGQLIFHRVPMVPERASYRNRGRCQGDMGVAASRGLG